MLAFLLAAAVLVSAVALLCARREYRERGRLSVAGVLLLVAMLLIPNLLLDYAMTYEWPRSILDYVGLVIGALGLGLCVTSIVFFRSLRKMFCLDPGKLTTAGPYRWSRNPQYLGYFAFLLGFALNDWSGWCLAALLVVAISLHLLVLIEEEHLLRTFGDRYAEFRRRIPRYIGLPRSGA